LFFQEKSRREVKKNGSDKLEDEAGQGIVVAHLHSGRGFYPEIGCVNIFQRWGMAKVCFLGINNAGLSFSVNHMGREGREAEIPISIGLAKQNQGKRNW
jgi:hypothetical protein